MAELGQFYLQSLDLVPGMEAIYPSAGLRVFCTAPQAFQSTFHTSNIHSVRAVMTAPYVCWYLLRTTIIQLRGFHIFSLGGLCLENHIPCGDYFCSIQGIC